ncbi:MAG: division/cell wall cluster transcriptional repressor MraZ [Weeksellaceae bacterium]
MVFYGEHEGSLTSGGRIALPKRIRETLKKSTFVLTKGFGTCLSGYAQEDWEQRAEELLSVSLLERDQIDKRRVLFSSTVYLEVDAQGRAVVPKNLRDYGALSKDVVIIGVGDHFEIWDKKRWEDYQSSVTE